MEYTAVLIPEPEGGFTVLIPAFPEYVGFAQTEDEARDLIREGIAFELERLADEGQMPPEDPCCPVVLRVAA